MTATGKRRVRVIALGSLHGGDDGLALRLGLELGAELSGQIELVEAGRPGPGLIELLDTEQPVLLLDVVRSGAPPGTVHALALQALPEVSLAREQLSSHGFGPAEAMKLARVLGRVLPRGEFVGVEGERFEMGATPSTKVLGSMGAFAAAARAAFERLAGTAGPVDGEHEHA